MHISLTGEEGCPNQQCFNFSAPHSFKAGTSQNGVNSHGMLLCFQARERFLKHGQPYVFLEELWGLHG